jgi:hypothetical protein
MQTGNHLAVLAPRAFKDLWVQLVPLAQPALLVLLDPLVHGVQLVLRVPKVPLV